VLLIGAFCFVVFLAEGSALDWSAVFLRTVRHVAPAGAGLGYAAFAVAMTSGRLIGDRLVMHLGLRRTVIIVRLGRRGRPRLRHPGAAGCRR